MEASAADEGARFELRFGWNVAAGYGSDPDAERRTAERVAGWADVSHLSKLELQGPAEELAELAGSSLELGTATRAHDAWWCPLTPTRALVIGEPAAAPALRERLTAAPADRGAAATSAIDVTTTFAALTIVGPQATEVFARFSALDLRPSSTPVGALRPGSIARQPAMLIREAPQRYLFLFGWATAEYVWSVVADAGHHLGGRPIGADALASFAEAEIAESSRA
jgi:heterotetrameric sarcosine oxidase gamma subunit